MDVDRLATLVATYLVDLDSVGTVTRVTRSAEHIDLTVTSQGGTAYLVSVSASASQRDYNVYSNVSTTNASRFDLPTPASKRVENEAEVDVDVADAESVDLPLPPAP